MQKTLFRNRFEFSSFGRFSYKRSLAYKVRLFFSFSATTEEVDGVIGGRVLLPCDVTTEKPEDAPILVLFYKESKKTPIYR